ncbi:hypothetical protein [Microvirga roseola]|uniref:hypothetical protein n=1 Tax=Microvirga roseola TaxID=2883126 RepID=UPI001E282F4A|nr:hypothetical protein [Microvirga roseola]
MQQFPRGFFWSQSPVDLPGGYISGPLEHLFACKDLAVCHAADGRGSITILGLCVGIRPEISDPAFWLLDALGQTNFYEALDYLCGRYAVFIQDQNGLRILSDATAMRTIFYRSDFQVIASHARLATASEPTLDFPFRYGFPGNRTPFADVKLLTPNTLIDLPASGTGLHPVHSHHPRAGVRRFWPGAKLSARMPKEAADLVLEWASTAIQKVAEKHPIRLALTAGLDSRAMLAAVLHSGVPFETYTYGGGKGAVRDTTVASDLAHAAGVKHSAIRVSEPRGETLSALKLATYARHHFHAVQPLAEWFGDKDSAAITANLLEIGRAFYAKMTKTPLMSLKEPWTGSKGALAAMRALARAVVIRMKNPSPPISAKAMRALYVSSMPNPEKHEAEIRQGWNRAAEEAFQDFIATSDFNAARGILDPFDQFYWEHRMAAWHGVSMLERDFYAQAFIPFNARAIWEVLLGVPFEDRVNAVAFYRLIETVDPNLLTIPINPREWSPSPQT